MWKRKEDPTHTDDRLLDLHLLLDEIFRSFQADFSPDRFGALHQYCARMLRQNLLTDLQRRRIFTRIKLIRTQMIHQGLLYRGEIPEKDPIFVEIRKNRKQLPLIDLAA